MLAKALDIELDDMYKTYAMVRTGDSLVENNTMAETDKKVAYKLCLMLHGVSEMCMSCG